MGADVAVEAGEAAEQAVSWSAVGVAAAKAFAIGFTAGFIWGAINLAVSVSNGETITAWDYLNQLLLQPAITGLTVAIAVGGAFAVGAFFRTAWFMAKAGEALTRANILIKGVTFAVSSAVGALMGGILSAAANKQSLRSSKTWRGIGYGVAFAFAAGFFAGGINWGRIGRWIANRRAAAARAAALEQADNPLINAVGERHDGLQHPLMEDAENDFASRPLIHPTRADLAVVTTGYEVAGGSSTFKAMRPGDLAEGAQFFVNPEQAYRMTNGHIIFQTHERFGLGDWPYGERRLTQNFDGGSGEAIHYFKRLTTWTNPLALENQDTTLSGF
jgi:hypothetical protein